MDIYCVNNHNERIEEFEATFHMEGMTTEIWHPETDKMEKYPIKFLTEK